MENLTIRELIPIVIIIALTGCGTVKEYVPVETVAVRTDTVERIVRVNTSDTIREREYVSDLRYDSIAPILDSIDRVIGWNRFHFREVTKMNDRERASLLAIIDSLQQSKTDSVHVEKPALVEKIVEVERKRRWWETALLCIGAVALFLAGRKCYMFVKGIRNQL